MTLIYSEPWDADCTPPALPGVWNSTGTFISVSGPSSGVTPTSDGQMVEFTSGPVGYKVLTYGAATDGNGGDCIVRANVNWSLIGTHHSRFGLCARGSASTLDYSGTDFYIATFDPGLAVVQLRLVQSGSETFLAEQLTVGAVGTLTWYTVIFTLNGTSLSLQIIRMADGYYLNAAGNWSATAAVALTATDGTLTSAGYAGIVAGNPTNSQTVFTDDWQFDTYGVTCAYPVADGFDTAPGGTTPACWTFDSPLQTTRGSTFVVPLSSPNVLQLRAAGDANDRFAMWTTADSNGGDTSTTGSVNADGTAGPQVFGVLGRADASSGPATYYRGLLDLMVGSVTLQKVVASTPTTLAGPLAVALPVPSWYTASLICNGTAISLAVYRHTDWNYLQPGGAWGNAVQPCLTATDSAIAGSGYGGLSLRSEFDATYADNFLFQNVVTPPASQTPPSPPGDRVKEYSYSTGPGPLVLSGPEPSFGPFSAIVPDGGRTWYCAADRNNFDWEVGLGTYQSVGPTISRDLIYASSQGGLPISFSFGTRDVFQPAPAQLVSRTAYALFDHYASVGSVGTGETTLYSDDLPGGTFNTLGDKALASYGFTLVNSASTKRVKLKLAGTTILDTGALTMSAAGSLVIELTTIMGSATSLAYAVSGTAVGTSTVTFAAVGTLTGLTLTAVQALAVTGTAAGGAAANNDVLAVLGSILRVPRA